jgi:hypothetical protein
MPRKCTLSANHEPCLITFRTRVWMAAQTRRHCPGEKNIVITAVTSNTEQMSTYSAATAR